MILHTAAAIVRRSPEKAARPHKQNKKEVTSALSALPAKWAVVACCH